MKFVEAFIFIILLYLTEKYYLTFNAKLSRVKV